MERSQNLGRAFFLCREKFGFSAPMSWRSMPPAPPSPETRSWIKSRDIAWAKGQQREDTAR
jgi:hypothetical protein